MTGLMTAVYGAAWVLERGRRKPKPPAEMLWNKVEEHTNKRKKITELE
jgi:hypothetical protein